MSEPSSAVWKQPRCSRLGIWGDPRDLRGSCCKDGLGSQEDLGSRPTALLTSCVASGKLSELPCPHMENGS